MSTTIPTIVINRTAAQVAVAEELLNADKITASTVRWNGRTPEQILERIDSQLVLPELQGRNGKRVALQSLRRAVAKLVVKDTPAPAPEVTEEPEPPVAIINPLGLAFEGPTAPVKTGISTLEVGDYAAANARDGKTFTGTWAVVTDVAKRGTQYHVTLDGGTELSGGSATRVWRVARAALLDAQAAKTQAAPAPAKEAAAKKAPAKKAAPAKPADPTKLTTEQKRAVGTALHEAAKVIDAGAFGADAKAVQAQIAAWLKYIPTSR